MTLFNFHGNIKEGEFHLIYILTIVWIHLQYL